MKIAIDLTPLCGRKRTGVEMYAIDLYRALLSTEHSIIPIFHVENELDTNPNAYIIKRTKRLWLENVALTRAICKIDADITLFPIFPPPVDVYCRSKSKIIPTLHDFTFLKYRKTLNYAAKYYLTPKYLLSFKKADAIITISETIKNILKRYTIRPIYNCGENISSDYKNCEKYADPAFLERWGLKDSNYIISVSTLEPRKNFKYLLKVIFPYLKRNNYKLVLVGRKGWGKDEELQTLIDDMQECLVFTEYVETECLISLYKYAFAFALLSVDEGFGRTPFEAVACGCKRVILSDIEIFHETFEENALFLPLNDVNKCTSLLLEQELPKIKENFNIPFEVVEQRIKDLIQLYDNP
ncbi:MAG: glycosyltransferase family 4 protein [Bacteroidaceae bacterium]|nr:glycosyltransferase family 4 protein [Bacteroidaceae bacterium]